MHKYASRQKLCPLFQCKLTKVGRKKRCLLERFENGCVKWLRFHSDFRFDVRRPHVTDKGYLGAPIWGTQIGNFDVFNKIAEILSNIAVTKKIVIKTAAVIRLLK